MGYTAPKTWAYKEVLSSSDLNIYVKDNIAFLNNSQIGVVLDYAGASAPTGYLLCQGQAVSRTTYAALYAIIGTTYGVGDGITTFNLPDCRGRVSVMKSTDTEFDNLGETGGEKTHLLTGAESGVPAHAHPIANTTQWPDVGTGAWTGWGTATDTNVQMLTTTGNNTAANAASAHNNLQPYIVFNKIIKY